MDDLKDGCNLCCQSLLRCFRKPQEEQEKPRRADKADIVIVNPHAAEEPPPSRPLPPVPLLYVALYDYTPRTDDDLRFQAGDRLQVLERSSADWWRARAVSGASQGRSGYIPANYVAREESVHAEPWYFSDTKRADAEKLLLFEGNEDRAFLIRECESQKGELSLSVLDQGKVKHYKVKKLENGTYYVSKQRSFVTLKELVKHYSAQADGLCVRLGLPCRKLVAPQTHGLSYNTADQWEIDRSSIKLLNKLGAGQFGEVYEGLWNNTTPVAVKTLKPGTMDPKDFLREAQIMKKLRHPKLIQLYAVCTVEEPVYIITELLKNGSLLEFLQKDNGAKLQITDQIEMASQVACGMAYLELHNYIHRDLAARNVLVGENNVCKVADFGLARVFMSDNIYEAKEGGKFPIKWTAPESIQYCRFTIKSDVWSFGILLYEIITFGKLPYPTLTNQQVIQKLATGYRMPCPPLCPEVVYDIMMKCWNRNEQDRPTFETLQWTLEDLFEMDMTSYVDANRYT